MTKVWAKGAIRFGACFAAAVIATAAGCGDGRDSFQNGEEARFGDGETADASAEACGAVRCSRDLRSVVDACDESQVVTACAPDQGCAEGRCVPACDTAVSRGASTGCEFVTVRPSSWNEDESGSASCFAAFVANTWGTPVRVEAEFAGTSLDLQQAGRIVRTSGDKVTYEPFSGELQPDEIVVLFLEHADLLKPTQTLCPFPPARVADSSIATTGRGSSYRIKTSAPVAAYSIYPFGGAKSYVTSATLLLPVPAWKTDYIVTNAWERVTLIGTSPTTQIIAAEDDTDVVLVGSVPIQSGVGVEGAEKGVPKAYHLNRGEMLQFVQGQELTGTLVSASKNVAVWGGHECMRIPYNTAACDQSTRQLFPVQSWGTESTAVPYITRITDGSAEHYFYRVMAAADGTKLTYDPSPPEGAPLTLDRGGSAIFTSFDPFVVKSQDADHPVALFEFMSSCEFPHTAEDRDGDPEFSYVVPADQYLDNYVFYVDPTYRNSQLIVVRARTEGKGFEPVDLDCSGPLDGWVPLGTEGKYEYTRFYVTKNNVPQKVGTGTCSAGRHQMKSDGAFGVTVWGTDAAVSYSYPGGAAIRALNEVKLPGIN